MKFYICIFTTLFSLNIFAEFDTKCSILITKRLQTNDDASAIRSGFKEMNDAYKDAINKINLCNKYDILSVTSFLEERISKVYITDLIQTYCMFDYEILTLLDTTTSNLSCVHRGQARSNRKIIQSVE